MRLGPRPGGGWFLQSAKDRTQRRPEGQGAGAPSPPLAGGATLPWVPALGPCAGLQPSRGGTRAAPSRLHWPARTPVRERGFESSLKVEKCAPARSQGCAAGRAAPRGAGARWPPGGVRFSFISLSGGRGGARWAAPRARCRPVREPRAIGNGYRESGRPRPRCLRPEARGRKAEPNC